MLTLATVATEIQARWREKGRKFTHLRRAEAAGGGDMRASEAGVLLPLEHGEEGGGVGGGVAGHEGKERQLGKLQAAGCDAAEGGVRIFRGRLRLKCGCVAHAGEDGRTTARCLLRAAAIAARARRMASMKASARPICC